MHSTESTSWHLATADDRAQDWTAAKHQRYANDNVGVNQIGSGGHPVLQAHRAHVDRVIGRPGSQSTHLLLDDLMIEVTHTGPSQYGGRVVPAAEVSKLIENVDLDFGRFWQQGGIAGIHQITRQPGLLVHVTVCGRVMNSALTHDV